MPKNHGFTSFTRTNFRGTVPIEVGGLGEGAMAGLCNAPYTGADEAALKENARLVIPRLIEHASVHSVSPAMSLGIN
ncbi:MAG: hypothetical protein RIS79_1135 [Verrucomicrobiota bacterium]